MALSGGQGWPVAPGTGWPGDPATAATPVAADAGAVKMLQQRALAAVERSLGRQSR